MKSFAETVVTAVVTAVIGALIMLALFSCAHPDPVLTPLRVWDPPACVVVLQPPVPAPPIFREWTSHCRDYDGRQFPGDAMCLTTDEAQELVRFAAQQTTWAITAWHACSESTEPNVRVME